MEVRTAFFLMFPQLRSLRPLSKKADLNLEKKIVPLPDEKIPWYEASNDNHAKKWPVADDLGLGSPVIQNPFSPKEGIPLS